MSDRIPFRAWFAWHDLTERHAFRDATFGLAATVAAMKVPRGLEGGTIVQHMRERYRTVIAGARHPSQTGKVIRIGTMGTIGETDIITDLRHLEATLNDLGRPAPAPHAGVRAALDALAVSA